MLDHAETQKGMQYFSGAGGDLVDLFALVQRPDGMIWSFVNESDAPGYFDTAYGRWGYVRREGRTFFARQPTENHPEYLFVNALYRHWKGSGDDGWMRGHLDAAARALDYAPNDPARWAPRFGLLKRSYTIDSWDFAVNDRHTPDLGIGGDMVIDAARTKMGVFFGDNTGYAQACDQLAEMLARGGRPADAARFRARAAEIRARLARTAWNGRFYTHHVAEDSTVRRDLGVDERRQLAQANAYSLNRGIPHAHATAIVRTYQALRDSLPPGSPGEWYAIYPPFERGFERHNGRWEYMNGGVAGHAAGELARGALAHGFERYGVSVLDRTDSLAGATTGRVAFAYLGSVPPRPPAPRFTPLAIGAQANMDLWDEGAPGVHPWMDVKPGSGDDLRAIPVGPQTFAGIPFTVLDPAAHGHRAVLAVSGRDGYPQRLEVPVRAVAGSVYLLHTIWKHGPEGVGGAVEWRYEDGTRAVRQVMNRRDAYMYWFPDFRTERSGVAWQGPSKISTSVGLGWAAFDNPHPDRRVRSLVFHGPPDDGIYAVAAATLADRPHYVPPNPVSYGGPDRWASGTAMAALLEGLAGVGDGDAVFRRAEVAPRWTAAGTDSAEVTVRYGASSGYVAYRYRHDPAARVVALALTGSGERARVRVLLPEGVPGVRRVEVDGRPAPHAVAAVEQSRYVEAELPLGGVRLVRVHY
jgi:hypothetical protein